MRRKKRWWLMLVLVLLMPLSGCDMGRQSSLSNNGRFMDLWSTYTHCYQSQDIDAMRTDAEQLSQAVHTTDSGDDPIPPESNDQAPLKPTVRLSADPAAMAAACALHAGQAAQERRRINIAREMFHMVVINFPQPRYQYYVAQARLGLERIDATN